MAINKIEFREMQKIFKDFLKIEERGFREVDKMSKDIWHEKLKKIELHNENVRIQKNHKPKNYRNSTIENHNYIETCIA